ncbi:hypothetical protein CAEBREN_13909 [Caenorhabditis brenneri]|uniref:Uncharacterized protein n=1 Tax=Caenorhabditis brenneri TaxID=135651 RepID=G0P4I3_CAEBE|nr:hypothetical protein CAEBREN_13909 [Caenorhabditis brenneri]
MPSPSTQSTAPPPTGAAITPTPTPTPRTYYVQQFLVGDVDYVLHFFVRESVIVPNPQYIAPAITKNS